MMRRSALAATRRDIEDYAERLELGAGSEAPRAVENLGSSGYVSTRLGDASVFVDVAPIGPDYLPGHAHADTLSFEMSLGKQRVIVNGGRLNMEAMPNANTNAPLGHIPPSKSIVKTRRRSGMDFGLRGAPV